MAGRFRVTPAAGATEKELLPLPHRRRHLSFAGRVPMSRLETTFAAAFTSAGERVGIAFRGSLDMCSADDAWAYVSTAIRCGATQLVLDLEQLEFMDSSGLNLIARAVHAMG